MSTVILDHIKQKYCGNNDNSDDEAQTRRTLSERIRKQIKRGSRFIAGEACECDPSSSEESAEEFNEDDEDKSLSESDVSECEKRRNEEVEDDGDGFIVKTDDEEEEDEDYNDDDESEVEDDEVSDAELFDSDIKQQSNPRKRLRIEESSSDSESDTSSITRPVQHQPQPNKTQKVTSLTDIKTLQKRSKRQEIRHKVPFDTLTRETDKRWWLKSIELSDYIIDYGTRYVRRTGNDPALEEWAGYQRRNRPLQVWQETILKLIGFE